MTSVFRKSSQKNRKKDKAACMVSFGWCLKSRFLFLLISILLLLLISPLLEGYVRIRLMVNILLTITLISSVYALSREKIQLIVSGVLAALAMLSFWLLSVPAFKGSELLLIVGNCFSALFFVFTIVNILRYIYSQHTVTLDVIYGAIVVYLLLGILWALVFSVMETVHPGSFSSLEGQIEDSRMRFFYYSYVTLTTLGYGDQTPLTPVAGAVSILEAIIGQLYLVVNIAWLVGMHISQSLETKRKA